MQNDMGASVPDQATQAPPEAATASSPSGECPSRGVFIFTITLSGIDEDGDHARTAYHGYAMSDSEDEARGFAVKMVREKEPYYAIHQILVLRIPDKFVIAAASGMEARRAAAAETDAVHDSPTGEAGDAQEEQP